MQHPPLPTHPVTGLSAIGWRNARSGENGDQPIWPIRGGSEADDGTTEETEDQAETDDTETGDDTHVDGEEALGEPGKRALDKMKADLRAERTRRKAAETRAAALENTGTTGTDGGDGKPDLEALRADALKQARAETLRDRALDRLEARAGRRFTDSADARAHLAGRLEDFVDGDQIDTKAIDEALDELLEAKPYLAATARRFAGTGDGGARKGSTGPVQLTDSDMKKMTAEQIDEAHRKGQFDELLGKKR